MGRRTGFMAAAKDIENRRSSARHKRRAAEKKASIPAMKKIIRRNRQK